MGEYVQGLLENRNGGEQKRGVTLRQLYHQKYETESLPQLPEIRIINKEIQVFLV